MCVALACRFRIGSAEMSNIFIARPRPDPRSDRSTNVLARLPFFSLRTLNDDVTSAYRSGGYTFRNSH